MRLSITLDPVLHQIASDRAHARGTTLSREINALLRQALASRPTDPGVPAPIQPEGRRGFPVSQGATPITLEDVARAENQEDLRHLGR
jgi:hypothetical protein